MLRIWRCDCAFCVIGNEFPCRQPHSPSTTLLRGFSTLLQGCFFYVFVSVSPSIYSQNRVNPFFIIDRKNRPFGVWEGVGGNKKASFERRLLVTPEGLEPSTH